MTRITTIKDHVLTALTTIWHDDNVEVKEDIKSGFKMVRAHKYIARATTTGYNRDAILNHNNWEKNQKTFFYFLSFA